MLLEKMAIIFLINQKENLRKIEIFQFLMTKAEMNFMEKFPYIIMTLGMNMQFIKNIRRLLKIEN